jgi:ABC-2 type transport system ATP-binding protein
VLSVAQIGNSLRVLTTADGDAGARIHAALQQAGLQAEVEASQPNLEDVFVSATRGREPDREAA